VKLYRYLTGPDDASFCQRVTESLSRGWKLYGSPTLTYDPESKRIICGQAIVKKIDEEDYSPDMDLSKQ
jgi:hypothetical protein